MTLPSEPPRYATFRDLVSPIRPGEVGWRVYALQCAINSIHFHDPSSGVSRVGTRGQYGMVDEVKKVQAYFKLESDGIVGPATQSAILAWCSAIVHVTNPEIPDGLMRGFAEGEGANCLAATNWSVLGGVDCGPMQLRVYGPPYDETEPTTGFPILLAFNPLRSMIQAAQDFARRSSVFYEGTWVRRQARREEISKRLAAFAHNWPTQGGADFYAENGSVYNPGSRCTWAPATAKFPDGTPVVTRQEWAQFYAMGGPHGEGLITKYVTSWS